MKNNNKADSTIKLTDKILINISKHADLNNPETVKQYIANKPATNGTKRNYCTAYARYCKHYGIEWQMPIYKLQPRNRRIPSTEKIDMLIARASPTLSLKLTVSKETGIRPTELHSLKVKDADTDRRVIYPTTAKNGSPRTLKISSNLAVAIQNHINRHRLSPNDRLFKGTEEHYGKNFRQMRNYLAEKLYDKSLKSIRLYDFRHYFATRLYAKTRDILYVKQQMGHKNIETTLVYTQLLDLKDDEWTCKVASNIAEAKDLIENGFEYVTEQDGLKLFRKRK